MNDILSIAALLIDNYNICRVPNKQFNLTQYYFTSYTADLKIT